jgi:ferritin
MLIGEKLAKALNDQIKEEFESAYLYLSMAAHFDDADLPGFAAWMKIQAQEELAHGMRIYGFIAERSGKVELGALGKPQGSWGSPLAAFEAAYKHEQYISDLIHKLVLLAREEKDIATEQFLQWFVGEQVEEESNTLAVVRQLKMIGDTPQSLFMIDRELGGRAAGQGTVA